MVTGGNPLNRFILPDHALIAQTQADTERQRDRERHTDCHTPYAIVYIRLVIEKENY